MIRTVAILEPLIGRTSDCAGVTHPIFDNKNAIKSRHYLLLGGRFINLDTKKIHSVMVTGSVVKANHIHNLSLGEYVFRSLEKETYTNKLFKQIALYRDYFKTVTEKNKTLVKR